MENKLNKAFALFFATLFLMLPTTSAAYMQTSYSGREFIYTNNIKETVKEMDDGSRCGSTLSKTYNSYYHYLESSDYLRLQKEAMKDPYSGQLAWLFKLNGYDNTMNILKMDNEAREEEIAEHYENYQNYFNQYIECKDPDHYIRFSSDDAIVSSRRCFRTEIGIACFRVLRAVDGRMWIYEYGSKPNSNKYLVIGGLTEIYKRNLSNGRYELSNAWIYGQTQDSCYVAKDYITGEQYQYCSEIEGKELAKAISVTTVVGLMYSVIALSFYEIAISST